MSSLLTAPVTVEHTQFPASAEIDSIVRLALAEDVGRGDLTTEATVSPEAFALAEVLQKAPGVLCGLPVVETVFRALDPRVRVVRLADEASFGAQRTVAHIEGPAAAILTGERTALNFLQRLSGVATAARKASDQVAGTRASV